MLAAITLSYPIETALLVALAFLVAGIIKGVLGLGLPAILMVSLTLFMPPLEALPLILLPSFLVNVVQYIRGPAPIKTARDYAVFAVTAFVVVVFVATNLRRYPEDLLLVAIGIAMILFAVPGLFGWRFSIGPGSIWQVVCGIAAGIIGGVSAIWAPAVATYLMGRNVGKDDFVGASGFLFMTNSVALGIALGSVNLLGAELVLPSMVGLGIALIGFRLGELIRTRINTETFRKMILIAFLFMGGRLMVIGLI
jgi:uncharacterized membrane protein YfcA